MTLRKLVLLSLSILTFTNSLANATEFLSAEQKERKIALCSANSLEKDTAGDFSEIPTPWFSGYVKMMIDPHEAFLARILLIQKAKVSIDISTYIFTSDETSKAIFEELRKAIRRGVNVRFLFDAGGSLAESVKNNSDHVRGLVIAQNEAQKAFDMHPTKMNPPGRVDAVVFHPLLRARTALSTINDRLFQQLKLTEDTTMNWNRRSHDKIFMIDKEIPEDTFAIVGGRNMEGGYFELPRHDGNSHEDIEILLKNKLPETHTLGNTLGQHFQDLFCSKGNAWLTVIYTNKSDAFQSSLNNAFKRLLQKAHLEKMYSEMQGSSGFDFFTQGLTDAQLHANNEMQNLKHRTADTFVDPNLAPEDPLRNGDSIFLQLRQLISRADKSIDICTPYIFVPQNERDCFKRWVSQKPGRKLRIFSNSVATTDSILTMTSFDQETAPQLMASGPYNCRYVALVKGKPVNYVASGYFDNSDHKIEVYEFGRLDNKLFKGEMINGQPAPANAIYGRLHAKFGIIDGKYSFVGSDNLDPRSRHLNSETTFFVASEKIALDLESAFNSFVSRAYRFDDPNLQTIKGLKAVHTRINEMEAISEVFENLPALQFAN